MAGRDTSTVVSSNSENAAGPMVNSSSMEAIISKVMETTLRPYVERLQLCEEKISRIDDTIVNLQTTITDLSYNVATL